MEVKNYTTQTDESSISFPSIDEFRKLQEEIVEIRKLFNKQHNAIEEIKAFHQQQLQDHDVKINKLQTRVNDLEKNINLHRAKLDHHDI